MTLKLSTTVAEQILTNGSDSYVYSSGIALLQGPLLEQQIGTPRTAAFDTIGSGNEFYYRIYDSTTLGENGIPQSFEHGLGSIVPSSIYGGYTTILRRTVLESSRGGGYKTPFSSSGTFVMTSWDPTNTTLVYHRPYSLAVGTEEDYSSEVIEFPPYSILGRQAGKIAPLTIPQVHSLINVEDGATKSPMDVIASAVMEWENDFFMAAPKVFLAGSLQAPSFIVKPVATSGDRPINPEMGEIIFNAEAGLQVSDGQNWYNVKIEPA